MGMEELDRWVTPRERRLVEEIAARLRTFESVSCEALPKIAPSLHRLMGHDVTLLYRACPTLDEGWDLEFAHLIGLGLTSEDFRRVFQKELPKGAGFGGYDPVRPEPTQRNRVLEPRGNLPPEQMQATVTGRLERRLGLTRLDESRALVCEGASVLAWVGGFRDEPFGPRDRAVLEALVPALRQRLEMERRLRVTELAERSLDALLARESTAAFVIRDEPLRVLYANEPGRAMLEATGSATLREALLAGDPRYRVTPIRGSGLPACSLVVVASRGTTPLSDALDRKASEWKLTRRQRQVLLQLAQGHPNKAIASELGISLRTVELHVTAVLRKANLESRAQLLAALWR